MGDGNTPKQTQVLLHEIWALHQMFRGLGFSADDIYLAEGVVDQARGIECVAVALKTQRLIFTVTLEPIEDFEAFSAQWTKFVEMACKLPDAELEALYEGSNARKHSVHVVQALIAKGFVIPSQVN